MFGDIFHLINGGPCAFYRIFPHVLQSKAHETLWSGGPTRTSLLKASLYNLKREDAESFLVPPSHEGLSGPSGDTFFPTQTRRGRVFQAYLSSTYWRGSPARPGQHLFPCRSPIWRHLLEARDGLLKERGWSKIYTKLGKALQCNLHRLINVKLEAWNGRMALQNFHITQSWVKIHELADIWSDLYSGGPESRLICIDLRISLHTYILDFRTRNFGRFLIRGGDKKFKKTPT